MVGDARLEADRLRSEAERLMADAKAKLAQAEKPAAKPEPAEPEKRRGLFRRNSK